MEHAFTSIDEVNEMVDKLEDYYIDYKKVVDNISKIDSDYKVDAYIDIFTKYWRFELHKKRRGTMNKYVGEEFFKPSTLPVPSNIDKIPSIRDSYYEYLKERNTQYANICMIKLSVAYPMVVQGTYMNPTRSDTLIEGKDLISDFYKKVNDRCELYEEMIDSLVPVLEENYSMERDDIND